ncbi:hypothetical protein DY000_02055940 [Brassica cretica]|uniref:Uncharacterized protein n=1 Tax=Brassica cretica TaxID=69181 RepID=A0ABQ7ALN0_BRACR|nr:hypothetical protein DY000_02055940 [Brassica cretica]
MRTAKSYVAIRAGLDRGLGTAGYGGLTRKDPPDIETAAGRATAARVVPIAIPSHNKEDKDRIATFELVNSNSTHDITVISVFGILSLHISSDEFQTLMETKGSVEISGSRERLGMMIGKIFAVNSELEPVQDLWNLKQLWFGGIDEDEVMVPNTSSVLIGRYSGGDLLGVTAQVIDMPLS